MEKSYKYRWIPLVVLFLFFWSCNKEETSFDCPEVTLDVIKVERSETSTIRYLFHAASEEGSEGLSVQWFLDGMRASDAATVDPLIFEPKIPEGMHEICFKTIPLGKCETTIERCETVTILPVSNLCDNLFFTSNELVENGLSYEFFANFQGRETIEYDWTVDDVLYESELIEDLNRDDKFEFTFDNSKGEFKVCIVARQSSCDQPASDFYCETLKIQDFYCGNVAFDAFGDELIATELIFSANFPEKENIDYDWYINDVLIESELVSESTTDHELRYNFGPINENVTVCIKTRTPSCSEVNEKCNVYYIDQYRFCPALKSPEQTWLIIRLQEVDRYRITAFFDEAFMGNPYWIINNGENIPAIDGANGPVSEYVIEFTLNKNVENTISFFVGATNCPENAGIFTSYLP